MQRSDEAPIDWREDQTEAEIRKRVLALNPAVVCFQELPGMVPYVETHDLAPANTITHSGNLATIVHQSLMPELTCSVVGRFAVLTTFEKYGITIANVHLEPTRQGAGKRKKMLAMIQDQCPTTSLLIVGDTNTRVDEESAIAQLGLQGARPPRPTWNSKTNGFRKRQKEMRSFSAYFTRYFHNDACLVGDVQVFDRPLERQSHRFYLSDHFALSGEVATLPSSS